MAIVVLTSPGFGVGSNFDLLQVADLFGYDNTFLDTASNPNQLRLYDDGTINTDFTSFLGTGFAGTVDGTGALSSVTAGTVTAITYSVGGVALINVTGMSASAVALFNEYVQNDTAGFLGLVLAGNDTITGTTAADLLDGFKGNDKISGGNGDDEISGGLGRDILRGGNNDDDVFGGDGNDLVYGDAGIDRLYGNAGRDKFYGGTGNDQLISNADGVEDTFVFARNYDLDTVINYEEGIDTLALNDNIWGGGKTAAQVVADYATVNAGGTMITFDFGGGDILRVKAPTGVGGLDLVSIVNDITIL